MTFDELRAAYETAGYHSAMPNHLWRTVRRGPGSCLTNDSLQIDLNYHEHAEPHPIVVSITGEYRPGMWTKLDVYSLACERAVVERTLIERELITAWDAVCGAR